jgi:hypothetical protein
MTFAGGRGGPHGEGLRARRLTAITPRLDVQHCGAVKTGLAALGRDYAGVNHAGSRAKRGLQPRCQVRALFGQSSSRKAMSRMSCTEVAESSALANFSIAPAHVA